MDKCDDRCEVRIIHEEKVNYARKALLQNAELDSLCLFFKTFADQTRLKILMALSEQEMCVCDIAAFLDVSESAVSHQLRFLRTGGLVQKRREGTVLYYQLSDEHVGKAISLGLEHIRER